MDNDRVTLHSLESSLGSLFNLDDWSSLQHQAYKTIRHYVNNFKENNKKYEIKDDKLIIRNNLRDQVWFNHSKAKPIMSHLLDSMTLINYIFDDTDFCLNFQVVISFDGFNLHACLYKNKENGCLNYYIFFDNDQKQRAYLTYYTELIGMEFVENMKNLKLPEFQKIYSVIGINSQIFYQYDLLNFFSEVIMYYDESSLLGNLKISPGVPVTLNQLINKFNHYISQKDSENGYKII
jgi:hypothetical protein